MSLYLLDETTSLGNNGSVESNLPRDSRDDFACDGIAAESSHQGNQHCKRASRETPGAPEPGPSASATNRTPNRWIRRPRARK